MRIEELLDIINGIMNDYAYRVWVDGNVIFSEFRVDRYIDKPSVYGYGKKKYMAKNMGYHRQCNSTVLGYGYHSASGYLEATDSYSDRYYVFIIKDPNGEIYSYQGNVPTGIAQERKIEPLDLEYAIENISKYNWEHKYLSDTVIGSCSYGEFTAYEYLGYINSYNLYIAKGTDGKIAEKQMGKIWPQIQRDESTYGPKKCCTYCGSYREFKQRDYFDYAVGFKKYRLYNTKRNTYKTTALEYHDGFGEYRYDPELISLESELYKRVVASINNGNYKDVYDIAKSNNGIPLRFKVNNLKDADIMEIIDSMAMAALLTGGGNK